MHYLKTSWLAAIVTLLSMLSPGHADELDDAIARQERMEKQADEVNEGQLEFLHEAPSGPPVHHQHNRVVFTRDSLDSGWVGLEQCHQHLDAVANTEIVFDPRLISNLHVVSHANIASVRVEGSRVQLENVGKDARLCIGLRSRALRRDESGNYILRNGPYMRRFLDGYYPLHVTMEISWPTSMVRFINASPAPQPGLAISADSDHLRLETWFAGRLVTELRFEEV